MQKLKIFALIASGFSILFSTSIVVEISEYIDSALLIVLSVFLLFILISNEYFKVIQLGKRFQKSQYSLFVILFTFIISFTLSGLGIYFWLNKTDDLTFEKDKTFALGQLDIEAKYQTKIDSLIGSQNNQAEYQELIKSIDYWKNRTCYNSKERETARNNVQELEKKRILLNSSWENTIDKRIQSLQILKQKELESLDVIEQEDSYKISKGYFIFAVFFCLVIITEIIIIYLQFLIANFFNEEQIRNLKIIKNLLAKHSKTIVLDHVKYNPFILKGPSKEVIWDYSKSLYFLFGDLEIIDHEGNFQNKKTAYTTLLNYYQSMNENI